MANWLKNLFEKKETAALPDYWQRYLQTIALQLPPATPISEAEFVVFDTETTGLDPKTDKVLSMGAVKVKGLQVLVQETFETLVQQEVQLGNKSAEVHGILPGDAQAGLPEQEALKAFLEFAGSAVLVGHHVKFDVEMLNQIARRQGINDKLRNHTVDTAQLAIRLERRHSSPETFSRADYSLDALVQKYNLPTEDRHTASGDAFTTAILLLKLLALAQKRGIKTVGELVKG
ncbi:3'-5' exonuclease [Pontibacter populi]|uniref:Exonuclease domain-containing protein n=1 Tax=Pontibacter populi TaxID=890055 RepID=A0ABV1RNV7_9BACT